MPGRAAGGVHGRAVLAKELGPLPPRKITQDRQRARRVPGQPDVHGPESTPPRLRASGAAPPGADGVVQQHPAGDRAAGRLACRVIAGHGHGGRVRRPQAQQPQQPAERRGVDGGGDRVALSGKERSLL
jgi:hypothetical protein